MNAVGTEPACTVLRKAGLARAVVAALSHPFAFCRTEAVLLCVGSNQEWVAELRDAGAVHALLEILRED